MTTGAAVPGAKLPGVLGQAVRRIDPVAAAELLPLAARRGAFAVTRPIMRQGQAAQQTHHEPFDLQRQADGAWRFKLNDASETIYHAGADGSLLIVADVDFAEHVRVEYDPPLRLLPGHLAMGPPASQTSKMTVRNLSNGSVRDTGDCTIAVELLGVQHVDTPAGAFDAVIVRSTRKIKLALAVVDVTILSAYAPGVGLVAEHVDRTTRALGLFAMTHVEEMRLAPR